MRAEDFTAPQTGHLIPTIHGALAFVPANLPPPGLNLEPLVASIARASAALGKLSGVGGTLQNPYLLIRPFMRREAVASSKIEGTVTNLPQLFLFELDEQTTRAPADAREVFNYVRALERSIEALNKLPISNRLIRDAHRILMTGVTAGRGGHIVPGEFKTDQNWIGARLIQNARFVPPPAPQALEAMGALENFINDEQETQIPFVIKLGLVHYQFETIHPFPDGNGRVGRLLIPLMLCEAKEMSQPLLYLSSYFEAHYEAYIDKLLNVSKHAAWLDWLAFFLTGIEETCNDAIGKAKQLQELQLSYRTMTQQARSSALLSTVIDMLFERPALTIPSLCDRLSISYNSAKNLIARLTSLGILTELQIERPKTWVAEAIMEVITA